MKYLMITLSKEHSIIIYELYLVVTRGVQLGSTYRVPSIPRIEGAWLGLKEKLVPEFRNQLPSLKFIMRYLIRGNVTSIRWALARFKRIVCPDYEA